MPSNTRRAGTLRWAGFSLRVSVPDQSWCDLIRDFTGLAIEPTADPAFMPTLTVEDDTTVLVDHDTDRRIFRSTRDMQAWFVLTVSDVLINRAALTMVHAAAFACDDQATLLCGPPWVGKSSWARHAQQRGLEVLGDDQVWPDPVTGRVQAAPRPTKQRVFDDTANVDAPVGTIRAHLDDEVVLLERRYPDLHAPVERTYALGRVVHLARHSGPGVVLERLNRVDTLQSIVSVVLCHAAAPAKPVALVTRMLARVPNYRLSTGDHEINRGLDAVLAAASAGND